MQKKIKKILSVLCYFLFFIGYFYILFVNLAVAFSAIAFSAGAGSRLHVAIALLAAFLLAVALPGLICIQQRRIHKLERYIEVLEKNNTAV